MKKHAPPNPSIERTRPGRPGSSLSCQTSYVMKHFAALCLLFLCAKAWPCSCDGIASIDKAIAYYPILVEAQVVSLEEVNSPEYGRQVHSVTLAVKKKLKGTSSETIVVEHLWCYASVLASGSLTFTDSGTTTPRTTWSDPGMTTPNPNPVPLDGAGRPDVDIWGDGTYRVVLKNSLGAVIVTLDNVSGPVGIPNPALQAGKFLTNDGTVISWATIRQVPDPTGQPDGNVLTTDGAGNTAWEATGIGSVRQVPDPAGVTDGWVVMRDDVAPGDYAWKQLPSDAIVRQWSDLTASRDLGDVYTNDSGSDIEVNVICNCKRASAGGGPFTAQCNFVTVGSAHASGSTDLVGTIAFTVPPDGTYSVSNAGANNGFAWTELRPV